MHRDLEPYEAHIQNLEDDLAKCQEEILHDVGYLTGRIADGNKYLFVEGDCEMTVLMNRPRTIDVAGLSAFAAETDRSLDFISIIGVKIKDCEKTFGKDLTERFSVYEGESVKKVTFGLTEAALKRRLAKELEQKEEEPHIRT